MLQHINVARINAPASAEIKAVQIQRQEMLDWCRAAEDVAWYCIIVGCLIWVVALL